ncbi:hypothetical protein AGLY_014042 [Aphis glycines]|uniref:Transposable element P transposase-like RNase H domain-containing protein n=1 Tax=Aphis glycines TaxID=307491 RepID=A0A6G0T4X1_APHGL|nr:hypothetical protein AGLY_014042 [Aphis glycines]
MKTSRRISLTSETIKDSLYIRINMVTVNNFNPEPAVLLWLNKKDRHSKKHTKATQQEYFEGVFPEAKRRKNQNLSEFLYIDLTDLRLCVVRKFAVESIQNNRDELFDLDTSEMSGIIELDTSQANSNAICNIQSNRNELIDLDAFMMSVVENIQNNKDDLYDLDISAMLGIIDTPLTDSDLINGEWCYDLPLNVIDIPIRWLYCNRLLSSCLGLLVNIGVRNIRHLTPRCKKLYSITNKLIKKQRRSDIKKELFKNRLNKAEKFADSYIINKLNGKVTAAASLFTKLQLWETTKKRKGHKFTLEEKVMSLSIYKKSPKCYRFLSNLFTLPCKRTYCSLTFDEISLSSGLNFYFSADKIDGFVNSGSYKSQQLADHALVIQKDSGTGLHIVATVCDQGKPKEGAIRLLNNETKEHYIKHNLEFREELYEVVGEVRRLPPIG